MLKRTTVDEFGKRRETLKCCECGGNPFPTHPAPKIAATFVNLWRCRKCGKVICENCGEANHSRKARDDELGDETWDCPCGSSDLEEIDFL